MGAYGGTAYGLSTQRDEDWRERALCRKFDPDIWFPIGNTGPAIEQTELAKAICAQCPVIADCEEWVLTSNQPYGVAAGMTPGERQGIRTGHRVRTERPAVRCRRQRHWMTAENTHVDPRGARWCQACTVENTRARNNRRIRQAQVSQP
jgi:WhiB family redox-sensing transcriptional regulator